MLPDPDGIVDLLVDLAHACSSPSSNFKLEILGGLWSCHRGQPMFRKPVLSEIVREGES